jgi:type I restriction enzyme S subunit
MSNIPKLRFREFSSEWNKNKTTIKIISGNTYSLGAYSKNGTLLVQGLNIYPNELQIDKPVYISDDYLTGKDVFVKKEDILLGLNRPIIGKKLKACLFTEDRAVLYQRAGILEFDKSNLSNKFLFQYLFTPFFVKQLLNELVGSDQPYIKSDLFKVTRNIFPSVEEQQKIASFLTSVDKKIGLLTQKEKLLKDYKKGIMQKIFSQEIRFKADDGSDFPEWIEKKLGDVCSITTGNSNREDSSLDGEYTFFDRSEDIRTSNIYLFDGEAVIVAGEGQRFIPKYFIGKFDLHQRTYAIMDFIDTCGKFIYYKIYVSQNYFLSQAVGSTVKSLRLPMFKKMLINLPSLQEQAKIANFLSAIDNKIEQVTKQLGHTKEFKKGLLQQMFV